MFDLGDIVPLTVEIRDASGALANAGAVTLTITLPDGTSITPAVANPSTGRYQVDYPTTQVGRHVARWVATGLNGSAYTDTFDVRAGDPGFLLSLGDAKRALNMDMTDASNDEELRSMIEAVTNVVEDYRSETIVRRTVVESISVGPRWRYPVVEPTHPYSAAYKLIFATRPVISVTSIVRTADGVTWTPADLSLIAPAQGIVVSLKDPFWGDLVATYVAGYTVIPANLVEAGKIIFKHLWEVQQTPRIGANVFGTGDVGAGPPGMAYAIPNRAAELMGGRGITVS